MTKDLKLNSKTRALIGRKVKHLRKDGRVPAVLYGFNIETPLSLSVDYKEFELAYHEGGENTLVKLAVDDNNSYNVVIHDVDVDPVFDKYIHVDLYAVNLAEKIITKTPFKFDGESDAVKNLGGVLVKSKDELEIESLPVDIPSEIIVDISQLKTFGDIIRVKNLSLPENITVLDDLEETIATVAPPRSEEELKALDEKVEEKVEEVKVEETGKQEEEGVLGEPEKQNQ